MSPLKKELLVISIAGQMFGSFATPYDWLDDDLPRVIDWHSETQHVNQSGRREFF